MSHKIDVTGLESTIQENTTKVDYSNTDPDGILKAFLQQKFQGKELKDLKVWRKEDNIRQMLEALREVSMKTAAEVLKGSVEGPVEDIKA